MATKERICPRLRGRQLNRFHTAHPDSIDFTSEDLAWFSSYCSLDAAVEGEEAFPEKWVGNARAVAQTRSWWRKQMMVLDEVAAEEGEKDGEKEGEEVEVENPVPEPATIEPTTQLPIQDQQPEPVIQQAPLIDPVPTTTWTEIPSSSTAVLNSMLRSVSLSPRAPSQPPTQPPTRPTFPNPIPFISRVASAILPQEAPSVQQTRYTPQTPNTTRQIPAPTPRNTIPTALASSSRQSLTPETIAHLEAESQVPGAWNIETQEEEEEWRVLARDRGLLYKFYVAKRMDRHMF